MGQGLRVLVLITTNEDLGTLHPAIVRPGRCAAQVEFVAFGVEEARRWLQREEVRAVVPSRGYTLAELYALKAGAEVPRERMSVGFAIE